MKLVRISRFLSVLINLALVLFLLTRLIKNFDLDLVLELLRMGRYEQLFINLFFVFILIFGALSVWFNIRFMIRNRSVVDLGQDDSLLDDQGIAVKRSKKLWWMYLIYSTVVIIVTQINAGVIISREGWGWFFDDYGRFTFIMLINLFFVSHFIDAVRIYKKKLV